MAPLSVSLINGLLLSFIDIETGEPIKKITIDEPNLDHLKQRHFDDKLKPDLKPFVYQGCLVVRLDYSQLICLDASTGELR